LAIFIEFFKNNFSYGHSGIISRFGVTVSSRRLFNVSRHGAPAGVPKAPKGKRLRFPFPECGALGAAGGLEWISG